MLITTGLMWLLLHSGFSRRMRERAERLTGSRPPQVAAYWALFLAVTTLATLPWNIYTDFYRGHQYGLSTQSFGPWLGDQAKALGLGLTWWIWGAVFLVFVQAVGATIFPVFVAPVFNTDLLRPPERANANLHRDAVETGAGAGS